MNNIAHSYSSLKTWRDCPRLHREKYVNKSVKDKGSPATQRGTRIHKNLEISIKYNSENIGEGISTGPRTKDVLKFFRENYEKARRGDAPGSVVTEHKIAINRDKEQVPFFDSNAWLRGVMDASWFTTPTWDKVFAVDWKTGQYRVDPLQADVTHYLLKNAMKSSIIKFAFVFVEHDIIHDATPEHDPGPSIEQMIADVETDLSKEAEPRPGWMCRYCPVTWCEFNGAS